MSTTVGMPQKAMNKDHSIYARNKEKFYKRRMNMLNVTKRQERILKAVFEDHVIDVNTAVYAEKICIAAHSILYNAHKFSKFVEVPYHKELLECIKTGRYK